MKKIDLSDRESIEIGIVKHYPLAKIAEAINKETSSISREVKKHRIFIPGSYYAGNDCKYAKTCNIRHLCDDERCPMYCHTCAKNCHNFCDKYATTKCLNYEKPPYVCNGCNERRYCYEDRYFYDAKVADRAAHKTRVAASEGAHLTNDEIGTINKILEHGIKKGQPLAHIFSVHENDLIISQRTAYRLINDNVLSVRNIDLRRKTRYKKRKKKNSEENPFLKQKFRQGRTYQDFAALLEGKSDYVVTEMDTVKGKKGKGKVFLTLLLRKNSLMLIFIMPDCKAESVIDRFDFLEKGLGTECFRRIFGFILTDNGSEFKRVDLLEHSCIMPELTRTSMYFCDPMASGQKGRLEKNHEYIRYVLKKGTSFNSLSQDDCTILMNHINSVKRPGLQNKSPFEMIEPDDEDMHMLLKLLSLKPVPADSVNLTRSLLINDK